MNKLLAITILMMNIALYAEIPVHLKPSYRLLYDNQAEHKYEVHCSMRDGLQKALWEDLRELSDNTLDDQDRKRIVLAGLTIMNHFASSKNKPGDPQEERPGGSKINASPLTH